MPTKRKKVAKKATARTTTKKAASSRVKKRKDGGKTQQLHPSVDDSDAELEKALSAYFANKDEHGELTRELTAEKQRVLSLIKDKKLKRYWSKKLERGVELKPEGEKLEEMKHPDGKKRSRKKKAA